MIKTQNYIEKKNKKLNKKNSKTDEKTFILINMMILKINIDHNTMNKNTIIE